MAEAAQNVQPLRQLAAMQVLIGGLIKHTEIRNGSQFTTIACPAKDEFSMPPVIEVKSMRKLGDVGTRIPGLICNVSGFIKESPYKDEETGQSKTFRRSVVYFEAVE